MMHLFILSVLLTAVEAWCLLPPRDGTRGRRTADEDLNSEALQRDIGASPSLGARRAGGDVYTW